MKKIDIRKYRERQGLSQEQLAQRLSVDQATIHRWETGQNRIPGAALKLMEILEQMSS